MRVFYVRYIATSIRNPLNNAVLGLKLLRDDMFYDDQEPERARLLDNVELSCNEATDLLDELFAYDKMDSHVEKVVREGRRPWD